MTQRCTPAHGQHTDHGTPHGYTSLTPHIVASPASKALEFYREVFGARVSDVTEMGGVIAHAIVHFDRGRCTVSDPLDAYQLAAPAGGAVTYSLGIYVADVDGVVERAVAAGARLREPVSTFVSGDRYGSIVDPFGVRWSVMTRVEDLSEEESAARVARWAASMAEKKP